MDPEDPPVEPTPSITQRSALAYQSHGSIAQWTTTPGVPYRHFGFTLGHGSWPSYFVPPGSPLITGSIVIWRNPNGDLWDQPGRYGSIPQWRAGQDMNFFEYIDAARQPLVVPWGPTLHTAGGSQPESPDNGIILLTDDDGVTGYEFQSLVLIEDDFGGMATIAQLNLKQFGSYAAVGHYRIDGVYRRGSGYPLTGSQVNIGKYDTLLKPRHLDPGGWGPDEMISLVGFNVAWGPAATAAPGIHGEHVEHPGPVQSYGLPDVVFPMGDDAKMMRPGEGFAVQVTDARIEEWVAASGATGALANSKRNFAKGCRGPVDINGRPTRQRIKLKESGTGYPIIESTGGVNPVDAAAFAARGIDTEQKANDLGKDLLNYGTLVAIGPG